MPFVNMKKDTVRQAFLVFLVGCILGGSSAGRHIDDTWRCPQELPDTTVMVSFNNKCYQFVDNEWYWPSARDYCHENGGHLVTINDPDTNDFLVWTLNNLPWRNRGVWIGLHDRNGELDWEWVTDHGDVSQTLRWENWGRGHPRGIFHTFRDCVRMVRGRGDWKWHETTCSTLRWKYKFICEYKMAPTTPANIPTTESTRAPTTESTTAPKKSENGVISRGGREWQSRADGPLNNRESGYRMIEDDHSTTENHMMQNKMIVPMKLKQEQLVEEDVKTRTSNGVTVAIVACIIGILSAIIILAVIIVRRRRQQKIVLDDTLTMENPMYGENCNVNTRVGGVPKCRQNDYVVNVYSNPLPAVQRILAKNKELENQTNGTSVTRAEDAVNSTNQTGSGMPTDDGYEQPRTHDYLPMGGESDVEDPSNAVIVIRNPRPVSDQYILPEDSHIYSEITDPIPQCTNSIPQCTEPIPQCNIYETLDEVTEETAREIHA